MHGHRRLLVGLCVLFLSVGWHTIQVPAQSTAPAAQSGAQIVDAIRFREIGPTAQGGRYVEFAVVESNPRIFYAATATGGLWKTVNNGDQFHTRLRRPARLRARCGGGRAEPSGRRLCRHRRVEQLAIDLRRQRRLQVDGRRQDLDESRPSQRGTHRKDRRPPEESGHRVRRRERQALLGESGPRRLSAPPTAARRGRRRSITRWMAARSARSTSRWIRRTRTSSMPRPTTRCAGRGRSARAAPAARSSSRPTAARRGGS